LTSFKVKSGAGEPTGTAARAAGARKTANKTEKSQSALCLIDASSCIIENC